ncbi:DnaJ family domain-containing protein [Rhodococcus sp. NPDC003383]
MTERKRPDITFESWVERQIRVAQERGDFDNLPGAGKPIPHYGDDELWWVKDYLRREGLSTEALLPPPLQLRKEIERLPETVRDIPTEDGVREVVAELNRRIVDCLRAPDRLPVPLHMVDADDTVQQWRADRRAAIAQRVDRPAANPVPAPPARISWWRRLFASE